MPEIIVHFSKILIISHIPYYMGGWIKYNNQSEVVTILLGYLFGKNCVYNVHRYYLSI